MARRGDGIYLRGSTWWLDFVHRGQRHVVRLGKNVNRTVARELSQVERAKILRGEAGLTVPKTTVKEYATDWLKRVESGLAPKTHQGYEQMLDLHVTPRLGDLKVATLDRSDVKALLATKRETLSKNTVRLIRATLSVMLADAMEDGLLKTNPAQGLSRRGRKGPDTITQAERQKAIRTLTAEQLDAFLEAARTRPGEGALFLTLADTGLRPSEALALQWEDLGLEDRTLWIERTLTDGGVVKATKTGTSRSVDLTPRLAEVLDRWQAEAEKEALVAGRELAPWIFSGEGGQPLDLLAVARRFRRLLTKARLPRFRLYDLRHTYATHLLAAGAPITYVAAQLGHAKPTTTLAFYAHWLPTADRTWSDRLEQSRVIPQRNPEGAPAEVGA
jgi:integrase